MKETRRPKPQLVLMLMVTTMLTAAACTRQAATDPTSSEGARPSAGGEAPPSAPAVVEVDPTTLTEVRIEEGPAVLTDAEIASALGDRLALDPSTHMMPIRVTVSDGVVELSGEVAHLLARRQAVRIARHLKGVRSVVDRLSVMRVQIPDARLERAVAEALSNDPATDRLGISVRVRDGRVTLDGQVPSFAARRLAEDAAASVFGVWDVENELSLEPVPARTDEEIQAELISLFRADTRVRDGAIEVEVTDGSVVLRGAVGSAAERARAIRMAWLRGVEEVDAEGLQVQWWAGDRLMRTPAASEWTPSQVAGAISDALALDPRIDEPVQVEVVRGVATLSGTVETVAARMAAEDTASNTSGVWRVRNWLQVVPPETPSDAQLKARIQRALMRDPYLLDDAVTVEVAGGIVKLQGQADHVLDRVLATHLAARVGGVLAVRNHIALPAEQRPRSDWELLQDVRDRLFWNYWVDHSAIDVRVSDGVVTLVGSVADWPAYVAALRSAREAGADHVRDRLRIEGAPEYIRELMEELRADSPSAPSDHSKISSRARRRPLDRDSVAVAGAPALRPPRPRHDAWLSAGACA